MPVVEEPSFRVRSTGSAVALVLATLLVLSVAAWHLAVVFLSLAPPSGVTEKYRSHIDAHVRPEFGQDWKLFAPNPLQVNVEVDARVRTAGHASARRVGPWIDLTAQDIAQIRNSLAPSHADQNLLRRGWDTYRDTHQRRNGSGDGLRGKLSSQYLKRIALQRIGREWKGDRIVALQIRNRVTPVPAPRWSHKKTAEKPRRWLLPWWPVEDNDYRGLGI
jgi:hypothetical protein